MCSVKPMRSPRGFPARTPMGSGKAKTHATPTAVQCRSTAMRIRRFGSDLAIRADDFVDTNPLVPPDYTIKAGDEMVVTLWGSIDAEVRSRRRPLGRIVIPRVGPVFVSGVRIRRTERHDRAPRCQVFRNFELTASLGQLRAQRVFVTGYVPRPGAYTVSSLTTVAQA
jgi:polysaccharide export outer membrane protein